MDTKVSPPEQDLSLTHIVEISSCTKVFNPLHYEFVFNVVYRILNYF